jgi:hypothetical protein
MGVQLPLPAPPLVFYYVRVARPPPALDEDGTRALRYKYGTVRIFIILNNLRDLACFDPFAGLRLVRI